MNTLSLQDHHKSKPYPFGSTEHSDNIFLSEATAMHNHMQD